MNEECAKKIMSAHHFSEKLSQPAQYFFLNNLENFYQPCEFTYIAPCKLQTYAIHPANVTNSGLRK